MGFPDIKKVVYAYSAQTNLFMPYNSVIALQKVTPHPPWRLASTGEATLIDSLEKYLNCGIDHTLPNSRQRVLCCMRAHKVISFN
jgi:hypothetical protein